MKHYFIVALLPFSLNAFSQEATRLSALPALYTVHIDEVALSSMRRFEQLNAAQMHARNTVLEKHDLPVPPGYALSTSSGKYFSLRPRTAYGDLDTPPQYPDDVRKLVAELVDPYSDTVHTLLRIHHNEIWKLDLPGSYIPKSFNPDPSVTKFVHLQSEWVKPPMQATYDSVLALFRRALEIRQYPLACIAFFSQYGTGANHFLWHARNNAEYVKAPSPEQVLVSAYGKEEGSRLYRQWQQSLYNVENYDAEVRPDLSGLRKDQPWLGITK